MQSLLTEVVSAVAVDEELGALIHQCLVETQAGKRNELETSRRKLAQRQRDTEAKLVALWEQKLDDKVSALMYDRLRIRYETVLTMIAEEELQLRQANHNFFARGMELLELCKGIEKSYLMRSTDEQKSLLKMVCTNLTTDGVSLFPTYDRPFDVLASRDQNEEWYAREDSNLRHPAPEAGALSS